MSTVPTLATDQRTADRLSNAAYLTCRAAQDILQRSATPGRHLACPLQTICFEQSVCFGAPVHILLRVFWTRGEPLVWARAQDALGARVRARRSDGESIWLRRVGTARADLASIRARRRGAGWPRRPGSPPLARGRAARRWLTESHGRALPARRRRRPAGSPAGSPVADTDRRSPYRSAASTRSRRSRAAPARIAPAEEAACSSGVTTCQVAGIHG